MVRRFINKIVDDSCVVVSPNAQWFSLENRFDGWIKILKSSSLGLMERFGEVGVNRTALSFTTTSLLRDMCKSHAHMSEASMQETYLDYCFTLEIPTLSNPPSAEALIPTLFVYHKSEAYPGARLLPSRWLRLLFTKLSGFHEYRGSVRPLSYMKELVHSRIGKIDSVDTMEMPLLSQVDVFQFRQIVLLWPDANGMGWFNIERQIF